MREVAIATIERRSDELFTESLPRGGSCCFIDLDGIWGVKVYRHEHTRNHNHSWQLKAADCDPPLGPDVGPRFDIEVKGNTYYCFITEVVETVANRCMYHEIRKPNGRDNEYWDGLHKDFEDLESELRSNLEEQIGFYFDDSFAGNWGWKNDRLICIDFDG